MTDPTPEAAALARRLYAEGMPVLRIVGATGLNLYALYRWLDGGDGGRLPPVPRRLVGTGRRRRRLARGDRVALVIRLWRTAERQVQEIEDRLARAAQQPGDRERDARTLAIVVRTLKELSALERDDAVADRDEQDEAGPADLDSFRSDLARRLAALRRERAGELPDEAEPD